MPTAIVTGASGGLGSEVTSLLVERGWEVLAQYHNQPGAEKDAIWWKADFTSGAPEFEHLPHRKHIHALIHCAGTATQTRCEDAFIDDWQEAMALHLIGPAQLTNQCLPALRQAAGHVIYINSLIALTPEAEWAPYCASKAAAKAWLACLRQEEPGIVATEIFADKIDTQQRRTVLAKSSMLYEPDDYMQPEAVARVVARLLDAPPEIEPSSVMLRRSGR
ncbi:SDR family NAD(P)-dependent oxidoreductase [Corynebacterium mendelii]|uniref:SDR family NAD(P)-dependent oxidoreductase n=1 Tax=Corynebacterium mendelii TaxID=2765362 RepID=A0A939E0T3_9CORY|nr:SDR family NAD(P)-dependent oxidoreductase [Corynebacterium mendelii]MBN9644355.1 SDR family NAD(P)-dependent oxidoreductase [Corynebacterium mendelii]